MSAPMLEPVLIAVQMTLRRHGIAVKDWAAFTDDLSRALAVATKAAAADRDLLPRFIRETFLPTRCRVLHVIAGQVVAEGVCLLSVKEIGELSNNSTHLARRAIVEAQQAGLVTVQRRTDKDGAVLTNGIHIPPSPWLDHIRLG